MTPHLTSRWIPTTSSRDGTLKISLQYSDPEGSDHPSGESDMESDQDGGSSHHSDSSSRHDSNPGSNLGSRAGSGSSSESSSDSSEDDAGDLMDMFQGEKKGSSCTPKKPESRPQSSSRSRS